MNAVQLKRQFEVRAKTLATVMASNPNIKVTIQGSTAFRLPGHINLPMGDFTDLEWQQMLMGWIYHELGHEAHTNSWFFAHAASKSPTHKSFLNIIEDVRMEKAVMMQYRGAKPTLNRLVELAIIRELFADPVHLTSTQLIQGLCMYWGRCFVAGQDMLQEYAQSARQLASDAIGDELVVRILDEVMKTGSAKNTEDAWDIAEAIIALLKEEQDADDDTDDTDDTDDSDDSDDSGSDDEDGEDGEDGETDDEQDNDQPTPQQVKAIIEEILNSSEDEQLKDFHETLAEEVTAEAIEAQHEDGELLCAGPGSLEVTKSPDMCPNLPDALDVEAAKKMSGKVFQTMNKVLFDRVQNLEIIRKTGNRIVGNKLSGIPAGNLSVFSRRVDQIDVTAAVSIVVDASGSMGNDGRMKAANTSALALALGLERCGVKSEVSYFGCDIGDDCTYGYFNAKSFDSKPLPNKFPIKAYGGTPTGNAMEFALMSLALRPEGKKLMLLLTDGQPDSISSVEHSLKAANALGVTVVPIGILTKSVQGFDSNEFVSVNDVNELGDALREAVKLKLFK